MKISMWKFSENSIVLFECFLNDPVVFYRILECVTVFQFAIWYYKIMSKRAIEECTDEFK
ncbi:hypothetical protein KSI01_15280 [Kurthia sibirica]|uniref:Uncharacterized protein n=1 Tax=Kurthia sibirica TaxID=202750 RepID=A0A2U3ALZ4_9BACL|nr:hypothetical protein DEX24_07880 [Kurthia sibirica]GEK33995.1 hypothetical protein KSI01_15280 [Kurthia sibirica]